MRQYLPLLLEIMFAAVIFGWGIRELILLKRDDENKDERE